MKEMQDYKTQAAANVEKKDLCDKHLRNVEGKMHQLLHNNTLVVAENEKCKMSLTKCADELEDKDYKTIPSSPVPNV